MRQHKLEEAKRKKQMIDNEDARRKEQQLNAYFDKVQHSSRSRIHSAKPKSSPVKLDTYSDNDSLESRVTY